MRPGERCVPWDCGRSRHRRATGTARRFEVTGRTASQVDDTSLLPVKQAFVMRLRPSIDGTLGTLVSIPFLLGSVLVGPPEAILGVALYWLVSS